MINDVTNKIICGDSRDMKEVPNESVHLIVTSPPYAVEKPYEEGLTLDKWFDLMEAVFKECMRVLVSGGRIDVNVANISRRPYLHYTTYIDNIMTKLGFLARGDIVWLKGASAGISVAWGSWRSPNAPCYRDSHEYILEYSKDHFDLDREDHSISEMPISEKDFPELTATEWTFNTVSAKKIGHPAPFPLELPTRCIKLNTYKGDIVLDPFAGSGQTLIAALKLERRFIGYEIMPEYVQLANRRISPYLGQKKIEAFAR